MIVAILAFFIHFSIGLSEVVFCNDISRLFYKYCISRNILIMKLQKNKNKTKTNSTTVFQFKILHEGEGIFQANPPNFFRSCGEIAKKKEIIFISNYHTCKFVCFFSLFLLCKSAVFSHNHKI